MRRPAFRLLLTLALSALVVGSVPATTEAGIIPWAYDTVFGPLGSIQGRRAGYYGANYGGACGANYGGCSVGCYQGPAPRLFGGFRAWRRSYNVGYGGYGGYAAIGCGGCSTGCDSCGGFSNYGYGGIGSCGDCNSCGGSCGAGGCGAGGCGIDGGYGVSGYGGGCASGQCNVNYPPGYNGAGASANSPVTPAKPQADANAAPRSGSPTQYESPNVPMGRSGTNDGYQAPIVPGPAAGEGFQPRGAREAAPTSGDPTVEGFVPPKVNTPAKAAEEANPAGEPSPNDTTNNAAGTGEPAANGAADSETPPVAPKPKAPKRNFGDDDEKSGTSVGPRFELQEKVTWRSSVIRSRQPLSVVRVSATVNRSPLFPKMAWKTTSESELAKK